MRQTRGLGRAIFAAALLMVDSALNIIYGIAGIGNSNFFEHNASYAFGSLRAWGWVTLIIGVLELFAAVSLVRGGVFGRWFGILAGSLAAIAALLDIRSYPLLSLCVFALSVWIVWGIAIYDQPPAATHTRAVHERPA